MTGNTLVGGGCLNPMIDPRDGTELRLDRSRRDLGDYIVPASRYGVAGGERLQLRCNTGHPTGS